MTSKGMRYTFLAGAVFFSCAAIACEERDKPVVIINDRAIYRENLDSFISVMRLCNAKLDEAFEKQENSSLRAQLEREMLQIMIDVELVRQEVERLSLQIDQHDLQKRTGRLVDSLLESRFFGSEEALRSRCKELRLVPEDLAVIPLYELQLAALFEHVSRSITEEDVLSYVEENPELLLQEEAYELYVLTTGDMEQSRAALKKLVQGADPQKLAGPAGDNDGSIRVKHHGWVTRDYPFVEKPVIDALFSDSQSPRGWIVEEGSYCKLYWIAAYRPDALLDFMDIRKEAAVRTRYVLYQDYFNALLSESRIEIRGW